MNNEQANKQTVTKAYQRTFGDLDVAAVDEFFSKDFVQHNPTIADGSEGVKALLQMLSSQGVQKQKIEFTHVLAEGEVVILHSRYEMAGTEWRFIDIYRVENGKLGLSGTFSGRAAQRMMAETPTFLALDEGRQRAG